MVKALLDTSVLIDILKGDKKATECVEEIRKRASLYTTTVNIYDILRGIQLLEKNREKHFQALRLLIHNINVIGIDIEVAESAAFVYAQLRKNGRAIEEPDYLIAGACLSNGISSIITKNSRHFREIKGIDNVISY
jgi:predicted nucleic acid-binding protein